MASTSSAMQDVSGGAAPPPAAPAPAVAQEMTWAQLRPGYADAEAALAQWALNVELSLNLLRQGAATKVQEMETTFANHHSLLQDKVEASMKGIEVAMSGIEKVVKDANTEFRLNEPVWDSR